MYLLLSTYVLKWNQALKFEMLKGKWTSKLEKKYLYVAK